MRKTTTQVCQNCKNEFAIRVSDVNRGRGKFCSKRCSTSGSNNPAFLHGSSKRSEGQTKEYRTWAGIKQRTTNPKRPNSIYYMVRGIKMCDAWRNSFEQFLSDMGVAPSADYTIERIDNNGDYEPGNCRWATRQEQMSNVRTNRLLEFAGEKLTQEEWGRRVGLTGTIICKRLKRGWSIEKTLTTPNMKKNT